MVDRSNKYRFSIIFLCLRNSWLVLTSNNEVPGFPLKIVMSGVARTQSYLNNICSWISNAWIKDFSFMKIKYKLSISDIHKYYKVKKLRTNLAVVNTRHLIWEDRPNAHRQIENLVDVFLKLLALFFIL